MFTLVFEASQNLGGFFHLHCTAVVHKWYVNTTKDSEAPEAIGGGCCFTLRAHRLFLPVGSYWSDAQVVMYFQHRKS